jgi:hypothetical protein
MPAFVEQAAPNTPCATTTALHATKHCCICNGLQWQTCSYQPAPEWVTPTYEMVPMLTAHYTTPALSAAHTHYHPAHTLMQPHDASVSICPAATRPCTRVGSSRTLKSPMLTAHYTPPAVPAAHTTLLQVTCTLMQPHDASVSNCTAAIEHRIFQAGWRLAAGIYPSPTHTLKAAYTFLHS